MRRCVRRYDDAAYTAIRWSGRGTRRRNVLKSVLVMMTPSSHASTRKSHDDKVVAIAMRSYAGVHIANDTDVYITVMIKRSRWRQLVVTTRSSRRQQCALHSIRLALPRATILGIMQQRQCESVHVVIGGALRNKKDGDREADTQSHAALFMRS